MPRQKKVDKKDKESNALQLTISFSIIFLLLILIGASLANIIK